MCTQSKVCFAALFAISLAAYGNLNEIHDIDLLKSVEGLQAQVMEIKDQYVSITSNLERIQLEIPLGLQNFPDIFNLNDQNLIIGPDGIVYYDHCDIRDYVSVMDSQSDNACDDDINDPDQTRTGYVTTEQFNQLADLVFTLSASCQTLRTNLQAVSNTVSSISQQMNATSSAIQNLNAQCETLNQKHATLDRVIDIKEDGRLVLRLSPILGNRESEVTPFLYQYPSIWAWEKICSKFNVATNSHLTSITLYCSDASKIPLPESVYVSAAEEQNGNYQMTNWYCTGVNTGAFPLITYTFTDPILIRSDRPHLLGIRKIGNNLIYPYVCTGYRNGGLFKPYGASEEEPSNPGTRIGDPPNPPDPPPMTLSQYMDMYFTLYMVPCVFTYEIWSALHFSEDIDFTFSGDGLTVESGNITVGGSEVVTSSSLGDMFLSLLSEHPDLLNSEINWDMFCDELKARLITTAGGTVTGPLSVNDLQINGRLILSLFPLLGNRESEDIPFLYQYPSIWAWDKICSKFNVSTNSYLKSITLYCDDASKILLPQSVYVSTGVSGANGDRQFCYWYCNNVNTNKFPLCTYSFADPILIRSDRFHTLGIRKIGDNLIYPYICSEYRNGGLYKPYGASEAEPSRDGSDPSAPGPRQEIPPENPSMTLEEFMNVTFAYDWEHCISSYELWSVLNFVEDLDFTFGSGGLAVESGNITVGGAEVVTSSSLGDMFLSLLSEHPDLLNSEITWDMFCNELKDRLITTAGGTVTGPLSVSDLQINGSGDWVVGSTSNPCDIVIVNEQGKISAPNGDLTLLATEGGNIQAQSFLQLQSTTQCGIVEISANAHTSSDISCPGLTSDAIILLTPRQETTAAYWVETNASDESFKVCRSLDGDNLGSISFNYLIVRK